MYIGKKCKRGGGAHYLVSAPCTTVTGRAVA